jgi:prepilin-type N-terminal cleavage/methylation domain-containing protein
MDKKAFTLVELLVVIAIIGLLATIGIVSQRSTIQTAKEKKVIDDFDRINVVIEYQRHKENKVLGEIIGWNNTAPCQGAGNLSQLPDSHECIQNWENAFNQLELAPVRDPYGSPYLIEANELEPGASVPCTKDTIKSAGRNKIMGDGDDFTFEVLFYSGQCTP